MPRTLRRSALRARLPRRRDMPPASAKEGVPHGSDDTAENDEERRCAYGLALAVCSACGPGYAQKGDSASHLPEKKTAGSATDQTAEVMPENTDESSWDAEPEKAVVPADVPAGDFNMVEHAEGRLAAMDLYGDSNVQVPPMPMRSAETQMLAEAVPLPREAGQRGATAVQLPTSLQDLPEPERVELPKVPDTALAGEDLPGETMPDAPSTGETQVLTIAEAMGRARLGW